MSAHPLGEWVVQHARNLAWKLQEGQIPVSFLLRDRDSRFTRAFDEIFASEGLTVMMTSPRTPRGELLRRAMDTHSTSRVHRPDADLR